jgi:hypothetical protein
MNYSQANNQKMSRHGRTSRIVVITLAAMLAVFMTASSFAALNVAPYRFHAATSFAALETDAAMHTAVLEKMVERI